MKKHFVIAAILTLTNLAYSQSGGDSWASVQSKGSGTINCIYYESPGLIFKEGNEMKGICADILKDFTVYVKSKYNKDVTINYVAQVQVFSEFLKKAQVTSNLLGVANTTITQNRQRVLDFSPHYISNPMVLITNNNTPSLTSINNISSAFKGYTAVVIKGSTHMKYAQSIKKNHLPDLKIIPMNNGESIRNYLLKNDKSFSVIDFTEYFGIVKKRIPIKRHNVNIGESTEELAFIMKKGSDWKKVWDEFLTEDYRNGMKYKKIVSANLGSSFLNLLK